MEVDVDRASSPSALYSVIRGVLDNELTLCREKLQRDIRRSNRRWNAIENEARLRLEKSGYPPKHAASPFKIFDEANTSTEATPAKTTVYSPNVKLENASTDHHQILATNAFQVQSPVPDYHHCHSSKYSIWTKNRQVIGLAPDDILDDGGEQPLDKATSDGKYLVLGFERSLALAEQSQRIWYFESSITRFIESLGLHPPQVHEALENNSDPSQGHGHRRNPNTSAIPLISRAVTERCRIPLNVALSHWLRPDVEDVTHCCRICKK
jgi:hypothetical protein